MRRLAVIGTALALPLGGCGASKLVAGRASVGSRITGTTTVATVTSHGAAAGKRHHRAGQRSSAGGASGQPSTSGYASGGAAHTSAGRGQPATRATATSLTPARFTVEADAICERYRRRVAGTTQATTIAAQSRIYGRIIDEAQAANARLRKLSAPASDAAVFKRFTHLTAVAISEFADAQRRSRSTQEQSGVAVEQQDFAAFKRAGHAAAAADAAARKLRLRVCGKPGSDWL
jgi:hypothetical protein